MANRRAFLVGASSVIGSLAACPAYSQETVKIGLIIPMTGPFATTGRQVVAGINAYIAAKGNTVAGKKIEVIIRDDAGVADQTRRISQEMVVNDGVKVLAGFGLTPLAMAVVPVANQAKIPVVVMCAGGSAITKASEYITRTSFTVSQYATPVGSWAADNNIKKVVTIVADYGPGTDAEKWFGRDFKAKGGQVVEALRIPLASPDFAPFLQRARDAKPDAVFVFLPSGMPMPFMKQFADRGLADAGIKLLATGDVTDDDVLNSMGKPAIGAITGHNYSAAHDSPENKAFVEIFKKVNNGLRPNYFAVSAYDGMALIYQALEKTKGDVSGSAFMAAVKGLSWMSPRGPISIDPETRDIIQDIYMREVKDVNGELYNVEFATFKGVKDLEKAEAK